MMEIDVTHLMDRSAEMIYYSASPAEMGRDAGEVTWTNAMECFDDGYTPSEWLVSTPDDVQEVKDYLGEFGAWDDDERAAWTAQEVNALLLQFIAGDIREYIAAEDRDELKEYQENQGGRLYEGDNGKFYYYIGM